MPLSIYTDGSCDLRKGGQGGWAAIIVFPPETDILLRGSAMGTTNNRMEFWGPMAAMDWMTRMGYSNATIFSDSQYVINTMSQWVWGWEKKGWRKKLANLDIIQPMHELRKSLQIDWKWVRGHNNHYWNEMADREAEIARIKQITHTTRTP
jgi:ribonuclease HI